MSQTCLYIPSLTFPTKKLLYKQLHLFTTMESGAIYGLNRARAIHCSTRVEQSGSDLKGYWILVNGYPVTSPTNYGKKLCVPYSDVVQIDKMLVYSILCTTT